MPATMTDTDTRTPEQIAKQYVEPKEPANEPMLCRRDRHKGYTKDNVAQVSPSTN